MTEQLIQLDTVDSTNTYLRNYAHCYQAEMVVVTANYQQQGKGQGTNKWESEKDKNLLLSILIHPHAIAIQQQFVLSMVGALSLKAVLDKYVNHISLKWPNDIYWKDKKLCGTLIETSVDTKGIKNCIFGIGLNVNQTCFTSDAPNPISLCGIIGHKIDRNLLLQQIIKSFRYYYDMLLHQTHEVIIQKYHAALYRRNEVHEYRDKNGGFKAILQGVDEYGHLILYDLKGEKRVYGFKEVEFIQNNNK